MTNFARGHEAEKRAAEYLKKQGYKIVELNWHVPRAEIDIVAQKKHQPITFFEVKYREQTNQGGGLDYITQRKLAQMQFAAEIWVNERKYSSEYQLGAVEVSGQEFMITNVIESITA